MRQVLHPSEGRGNPAEVVLEEEDLAERRLLDEDAVGDVEQVAVGQVQALQLLYPCEGARVKVTDVVVVGQLQLHQVREALRREGGGGVREVEDSQDALQIT